MTKKIFCRLFVSHVFLQYTLDVNDVWLSSVSQTRKFILRWIQQQQHSSISNVKVTFPSLSDCISAFT